MVCANCGASNRPGARFCNQCGTSLAAACPNCGALNLADARFCEQCATQLRPTDSPQRLDIPPVSASARPVTTAAAAILPTGERRIVSVLFVDIVGFTPFSAERDAEDVRDTLTRYFDVATDVVARHGGLVDKFIGDAVTAVWGAPVAREDDAERAVRAGLELVDAVRGLGSGLQARAGVLTGEAAVTFVGATNQGTVVGDLVNTASRLQSAAPPGTVLVGEATQRAASGAIAFEEVGEQQLKGKSVPVRAWRALRVVAERGGRNRSDTLEPPFVGRDDDFRLLKELFHAASRERHPRLVSVVGSPGIGKSRLAWEFVKYLDGLVEPVWWHEGRSPSYGEGISFWALGEMVRARCGLVEADDEETTRSKVAETLRAHVPDAEERAWIEPALLSLLGIAGGIGSEQLFGAWRTFFERLAGSAPVVMVFEDFQFADPGLVDFVDHVVEWSRNVPIYVLTLARPDLLEKRPSWGAGKRSFHSISLEPLLEPAMRELLLGLVPGLPEVPTRAVIARADGVPLYAVETVRMLVAEGRLKLEDGVYRPVGDLTSLAVPETLAALIASRLDGLEAEDRALVSDAAVLGHTFTLAALSAVSGVPEAQLEPRLRGFVRRELVTVDADPRSPERGQYEFVQALVREVAYNTLGRRDRASRHLAAARYFETIGTDELAGALAGHYLAAHANTPEGPERDALAGQARLALKGAAERARKLGSFEQAAGFYEQALTVTVDPRERASLLGLAGNAASAAGQHDRAVRLLQDAVDASRALGDFALVSQATADLGAGILVTYRVREALAVLEPALAELKPLGSDRGVIAIGSQLARAYMLGNEMTKCVEVADRVLEVAERLDARDVTADTLVTKGTALAVLGRPIEGEAVVRAGQQLAEELGLGATLLRAYINSSEMVVPRDPRAALDSARAGRHVARRLGRRDAVPTLTANAAKCALRTGDWERAGEDVEDELAVSIEALDRVFLLQAAICLRAVRGLPFDAQLEELRQFVDANETEAYRSSLELASSLVAFLDGRLAEARSTWHDLTKLDTTVIAESFARAARAALWMGDLEAAREDLASLDATAIHGRAIDADRTTIAAGIAALDGRPDEALARYRDALRVWRELGLAWDEALTGIDVAMLLDRGREEVRSIAQRSRETLARLGAAPLLARLDTLLATSVAPRPAASRAADPQRAAATPSS